MNIVHQLQLILLSKYAADSSLFERCQEHTRGAHRFILLMLAAEQGPKFLDSFTRRVLAPAAPQMA